jgi:hypothetical protein
MFPRMGRRYAAVAVGVVAACLVVAALAANGASPSHSRQPPAPTLETLGVTQSATLVSYCWSYQDRPGTTACVDGSLAHPPHVLRWRPRTPVRLDLHLPAHDVGVEAIHPAGQHGRVTHVQIRLRRVDSSERRWVFYVPPATKDHTVLSVSATYAQGNAFAEISLRAAGRPSSPG